MPNNSILKSSQKLYFLSLTLLIFETNVIQKSIFTAASLYLLLIQQCSFHEIFFFFFWNIDRRNWRYKSKAQCLGSKTSQFALPEQCQVWSQSVLYNSHFFFSIFTSPCYLTEIIDSIEAKRSKSFSVTIHQIVCDGYLVSLLSYAAVGVSLEYRLFKTLPIKYFRLTEKENPNSVIFPHPDLTNAHFTFPEDFCF